MQMFNKKITAVHFIKASICADQEPVRLRVTYYIGIKTLI